MLQQQRQDGMTMIPPPRPSSDPNAPASIELANIISVNRKRRHRSRRSIAEALVGVKRWLSSAL